MKAEIYDILTDAEHDMVSVLVYFLDSGNGNALVEDNNVNLTLSAIDLTSNRSWRSAIEAAVIAHNAGYALAPKDVLWMAPAPIEAYEVEAMNGYTSALIDGKTVGNTTVFTNSSGKDFVLTEYWILPMTITGLGTAPVINVGKTASAYNDIDSGLALAVASQAGKFTKRDPNANAVKIANGESLVVRVATAAILTTAYTFKVIARGVYIG